MDLDLAHVRAFVTAADHLHFGQAAKDLSLSQQALSARISRLEGGLGVKLFVRGARGSRSPRPDGTSSTRRGRCSRRATTRSRRPVPAAGRCG
ncbi:LysR family transcriptional regulator [Actinomadura sp. J1-007]|uniref:LysR family transcriptional regulator n=1 Tax=Actinomadura sp. J1-007 TaxID=2661913 RepID=UPI001322F022|nr:LysR family transcriptional regulator [Actinomadura sp. J1-007]